MQSAGDFFAACMAGDELSEALRSVLPVRKQGQFFRALRELETAASIFQGPRDETRDALALVSSFLGTAVAGQPQGWLIEDASRFDVLQISRSEEFDLDVSKAISESSESCPLALMMVDVDHFKAVNDTHGHPVGTKVLKIIAASLRQSISGRGKAYRYGGEEFAILMPNVADAEAFATAERIRTTVASLRYEVASLTTTVSVGVTINRGSADRNAMLESADKLLYQAKQEGRNRVAMQQQELASPSKQAGLLARAETLNKEVQFRKERLKFRDSEAGVAAFKTEAASLETYLQNLSDSLMQSAPELQMQYRSKNHRYGVYSGKFTLTISPRLKFNNSLRDSELLANIWDGHVPLPGEMSVGDDPHRVAEYRYVFDISEDGTHGWKNVTLQNRHFMTTDEVAEQLMEWLVDLYKRSL